MFYRQHGYISEKVNILRRDYVNVRRYQDIDNSGGEGRGGIVR